MHLQYQKKSDAKDAMVSNFYCRSNLKQCVRGAIVATAFAILGSLSLASAVCFGQGPEKKPSMSDTVATPSAAEVKALDQEQRVLADRFSKLEELFIRMSELEAASNPTRASLLQQAAQLSKQLSTLQRLQSAADLLAKGQYSQAIKEQESTKDGLTKLLELLQSENRQSRIRDDRERIEALIKDIQRIERLQRSLRGRTEGGQDAQSAQRDQEDIRKQAEATEKGLTPEDKSNSDKDDSKDESPKDADKENADKKNANDKDSSKSADNKKDVDQKKNPDPKSDKSSDKMKEDSPDNQSDNKSDNKSHNSPKESESKPSEKKSDMKSPGESPQDSDGKPSDKQPSEQQESQKDSQSGKPQSGDSEAQDSESKKSKPEKPLTREEAARKRLQQAQKKMQQAQEELKNDERESATQEQQAAEEELRIAAEELERILRQLREEEVERSLADLESRLRRMLQMQTRVADQSKATRDTPRSNEDRTFEIQCSKLAIEERKVQMEGQKALLLLQDEGSSLAFPEAVEQVNRDVALVIEYFAGSRIDDSCIGLQSEIIRSLEEMIESLTETQRKMEEKKKKKESNPKQPGNQGGEQEEQPLVDALAELRLIKTLQLRINTRTERLANESGKADDPKGSVEDEGILRQLQDLSERQEKIKQVTRDIILEQTKK